MKNYIVIGGSSGIGKELVNILENEGHQVYATYNNNPVSDSTLVKYQKLDVLTDTFNTEDLPDHIDGLAYCPGQINLKSFKRFKEEDFLQDFKLQVLGATNNIKELLPKMTKNGKSSIVMFSTIAVQSGFNFHSQVAISKGAIEGLTRSLAAEFAPIVRVNAIAPSLTNTSLAEKFLNTPEKVAFQTEKNPLKKVGQARDIAESAAFLLSDKSSWITGQILHLDGGASVIK